MRNGIVDFGFFANWRLGDGGNFGMILSVEDDFLHSLHGLERVFAIGGFIRKHDYVGALDDSSRDIGNFGTGGLGRVDHGTKHLSSDDAEFGMSTTHGDELALNHRDDFGAGFDGHIATGDHDAIGSFDDFFEMLVGDDSFLSLNFGDYLGCGAEGKKHLLEINDVASGLNERKGNIIVITIRTIFDIGDVFRGQDVATEVGVREIETFFGHDEAVVLYLYFDGGGGDDFCDF